MNFVYFYSFELELKMTSSLNLSIFKNLRQSEKDIVYGYIKHSQSILPQNSYYNIPQIVIVLCTLYCMKYDEWDPNCKGSSYKINEDDNILTMTGCACEETAFMKKITDNEGKYHWKFKLLEIQLNIVFLLEYLNNNAIQNHIQIRI